MLVDWETRSTNNHEEAQQHTAAATNSTLQVQMLNLPEATENHTAIPTHQDIKIMNSIESQDDSCQIVVAASTACLLSAPREGGAAAAAGLLSAPREGGAVAATGLLSAHREGGAAGLLSAHREGEAAGLLSAPREGEAAATACLLTAPREGEAAATACLLSAPREGGPTAEAYTRTAPSLISPPPSEKAMAGEPQAVRKPPSAPRKSRKKAN